MRNLMVTLLGLMENLGLALMKRVFIIRVTLKQLTQYLLDTEVFTLSPIRISNTMSLY